MSTLVARFTAAFGARYEVERELGTGATATVFLANDVRYQRRVAVKLFRPEVAEVMGHERFAREIALVAKLNHPHIVPLLDSGEVDGMMFYVMPAVDGETLRERMTRESTLPVDEAIRISHDVAVALDYAHLQGVVHRDIKPENILLTAGTAVVTDFGIAKMLNAGTGGTSLTRAGMAVGTVTYMSPEQASAGEVDGRADVYSLGCVLFEMLAGRPPFVGTTTRSVVVSHFTDPVPSLHRLRAEVAPSVEMAICKALAKNPVERFATATDFMRELAKARRAASRERMWMQLGGTTPPPKSGEWHRKDVPTEFASPSAATPGRVAAPTPSAAAQPHRPVTPMGVPATPPVGDRADPVAHGSHTGVGATTGEGAAGGTGSTRWILAAGVVIVAGALAWFLLR
ncbi:MAG: protein kinase [Gemmatimonadota bacterium]